MDQKNWVANHDGNITVKVGGDSFLSTPGARSKGSLIEEDLVEVNAEGKVISGKGSGFSEMAVHLRIYRQRPDVQAIVHAHPPSATAVGCANQEMVTWAIPEAVVSLGPGVPLVGLTLPNSEDLWSELDPLLPHYDAVMVAGNGVFSWGSNLEQAFLRLELVEQLAHVFMLSLPLGGPRILRFEQVAQLLEKRKAVGLGRPADPARPHWFNGSA